MTVRLEPSWEQHSRELTLTCDARGTILALDARAARILQTEVGAALSSLVVPGCEVEARALLEKARTQPVQNWQLAFIASGRPSTLTVSTRPGDGDGDDCIHLYACVLPNDYSETVRHLSEATADAVELQRQLSNQRQQLAVAHNELDESNRGVVSLHAEIADKADTLRRAAEVKGRVLANVSHEFRTPLHTILGLSKLLLDASDGPLTEEQRTQIRFIRSSAEELSGLVNDMLDLSKAEAGKAVLRPEAFTVSALFASLRGQLRPLVPAQSAVELLIEDPAESIRFDSDQGKIAQIIRNLVSNALKFTERGHVKVRARTDGVFGEFSVEDTGIGISVDHYDTIFEEFGQVDSPLQLRVKGTGLGLWLSRKLAELLGGTLSIDSQLGRGSTFTLSVPLCHAEVRELASLETRPLEPGKSPVLVVEDDRKTIFIYERYLAMAGFQVIPARNIEDARRLLESVRPAAIVLDIMLEGESSWNFLGEIKRNPATQNIPVLVVTVTNKEQKARALGADEFWLKPVDQDRLLRKLRSITKPGITNKVLVVDDDHKARYLMRKYLERGPYQLLEAASGPEGIRFARAERPAVILLDFLLQDMTAFDVLDELKADPATRGIPVVIVTSQLLDADARKRLAAETEAILSKDSLSRELAINRIRDALQKAGLGHVGHNQSNDGEAPNHG